MFNGIQRGQIKIGQMWLLSTVNITTDASCFNLQKNVDLKKKRRRPQSKRDR